MTTGKRAVRNLCLTLLGAGLLAILCASVLKSRLGPVPSLDGLPPLLAARRFDEVEQRISRYLRLNPASAQGNLLMAQVCLARDDQKPKLALDHLGRIRAGDRSLQAAVLLNEGKAYSALGRNDRAESAWKEALRLDPTAPEVGWDLLGLYYVQGRREDAHRLALALHGVEPDPRDRAQLLLELLRQDAQPIGPDSLIRTLEPVVRAHPGDIQTALALGLALVRNSRVDDGLAILRARTETSGDNPDTWIAMLRGLDEAGKFDELSDWLARVPSRMASDPRLERYRGSAWQHHQDWPRAADAYLRAWRAAPDDMTVLYRLSRALRAAGRGAEADTFDQKVRGAQAAKDQILPLYEEANAVKALGVASHRELYHRLADLRERMGRYDEALAWHRLVLRDQPDEPTSQSAIKRLRTTIDGPMAASP